MKISKQISYFCVLTVILIACHRNIEDEFTTVTPDELYSLFSFDTQKDVYENLQLLNSFSTEKQYHVNRKTIVVSNCIPDNIDASQGRFSLTVTGTVNYTPFQEILNFKGFKIETPDERNKNEDEKNESDDKRNESENESGNSEDAQTASHTITKEELKSIFIFDTNQTVTVVLADLEQFNGEKHINGKSIFIDKIIVQQQDTQSGTFTLLVTGNVNGQKDFEETLDFAGFALEKKEEPVNKPTDYNMTKRASIQIAHDKNIYESNFDTFYRENNSDEFALQLKDFITISSSNNGTGKTTMLKILNGLLDADAGSFSLGAKVQIGYYDQEHHVLHAEKTIFEEISDTYPTLTETQIRNMLAAFLFTGDDVFKVISSLSGGERGRVSLAKLMLSEANFLILDEPTNHLDIASKEILEEALNSYTGTVLYVSHDRYFINQTATRILDLTNQSVVNYIGDYDYYLEKKEELTEKYAPSAQEATEETKEETPSEGRLTWQQQKEEQARKRKQENELKKVEKRIEELETRDKEIDDTLVLPDVCTNVGRCAELSREKDKIQAELEELYEKWEELA